MEKWLYYIFLAMFCISVCGIITMATSNESSNSTIIKPVVPAPPQKTIPVDDTPIEEVTTPIEETPIEEQMQIKEQAQLEEEVISTDEIPIEEGQEPVIMETPEPVITETPIVTPEKPTTEPITGVKCCHTNEKMSYTGDYYTVTSGAHGEIYLGAANKNKEFIIIPVNK